MLANDLVTIGRAVKESGLTTLERINWLTDVTSPNAKNFFQHVFIVEICQGKAMLHYRQLGEWVADKKGKEEFMVDRKQAQLFPFFFPSGGNPIKAQGVYPLPCYLLYDRHIKSFYDVDFASKVILPRLERTVSLRHLDLEDRLHYAELVASCLKQEAGTLVKEEKQLGILLILDPKVASYNFSSGEGDVSLQILESAIEPGNYYYLNEEIVLDGILEARIDEARTLGSEENEISTFSNQKENEVVSLYNKSWLWLSPTWEPPKSIYWKKDDWTKGVKVDHASYESFLYGSQLAKSTIKRLSSSVLKEIFAPTTSPLAKKSQTRFDEIFGLPLLTPVWDDGNSDNIFYIYKRSREWSQNFAGKMGKSIIHLELISGISKLAFEITDQDNFRLKLVYFSGQLQRGDVHIRAVIEDVIPSVAQKITELIEELKSEQLTYIYRFLQVEKAEDQRMNHLPSMLANAYGQAYVWTKMQEVLRRQDLHDKTLVKLTALRLTELFKTQNFYSMKYELAFFLWFDAFLYHYHETFISKKGEMRVTAWAGILAQYQKGELRPEDLDSDEKVFFAIGVALRHFSNSWYAKDHRNKQGENQQQNQENSRSEDFLYKRVIGFSNRVTPDTFAKGLQTAMTLAGTPGLSIGRNFDHSLEAILPRFHQLKHTPAYKKNSDDLIIAFWAGYHSYKKAE